MISDRQVHFIGALCSELGWSDTMFKAFVERELGLVIETIRDIGSSKAAAGVINKLLAHKRSKQRKTRGLNERRG